MTAGAMIVLIWYLSWLYSHLIWHKNQPIVWMSKLGLLVFVLWVFGIFSVHMRNTWDLFNSCPDVLRISCHNYVMVFFIYLVWLHALSETEQHLVIELFLSSFLDYENVLLNKWDLYIKVYMHNHHAAICMLVQSQYPLPRGRISPT